MSRKLGGEKRTSERAFKKSCELARETQAVAGVLAQGTMLAVNGTVGQAIADYMGRKVDWVKMCLDPVVVGTYAIRAQVQAVFPGHSYIVDFLIKGVALTKVTPRDLEEVEFTEWPPSSRN